MGVRGVRRRCCGAEMPLSVACRCVRHGRGGMRAGVDLGAKWQMKTPGSLATRWQRDECCCCNAAVEASKLSLPTYTGGVGSAIARRRQQKARERGDGDTCASVRRCTAMRCSAINLRHDATRLRYDAIRFGEPGGNSRGGASEGAEGCVGRHLGARRSSTATERETRAAESCIGG
jgi:hypothetical protein